MKDEWRGQSLTHLVAWSPNILWKRQRLLFPCCCRVAVADDDGAVEFELLLCLGLLLKRGRLWERGREPLKLFFLTKLTSVSSSSNAVVKADEEGAVAAG